MTNAPIRLTVLASGEGTNLGAVLDAIAAIDALDFVAEPTCYLRVEDLA